MNSKSDKNKLRCFIGIHFSLAKELRFLNQSLVHIASDPRSKLRVVDESNLHVTLKFLGSIEHDQVHSLIKALSALEFKSTIKLKCQGLGFFYHSHQVHRMRQQHLNQESGLEL